MKQLLMICLTCNMVQRLGYLKGINLHVIWEFVLFFNHIHKQSCFWPRSELMSTYKCRFNAKFGSSSFYWIGKDWKWGTQDGGSGSVGYVYDVNELTGIAKVIWWMVRVLANPNYSCSNKWTTFVQVHHVSMFLKSLILSGRLQPLHILSKHQSNLPFNGTYCLEIVN